MTQRNQKKNQNRTPRHNRTDDFRWEKFVSGGLRIFGDSRTELTSIKCSVFPREEERRRISTKSDPKPRVQFRFMDLLNLIKNGTFEGSVKIGLISGKVDGDDILLFLAPTSLQSEEIVSQSLLLERTVQWRLSLKAVEEAKAFTKLLHDFGQKVRALKDGPVKAKAKPTGILRPMENTERKTKVAPTKSQSKVIAKSANRKEQPSSSQPEPRVKPASAMGTLGDVLSSQLPATIQIAAPSKTVDEKSKSTVTAPKPNPKAKNVSQVSGQTISEVKAIEDADARSNKTKRAEEKPTINARQARMYLAALKKNGGDLNALNVKNPVNLRFIRETALKENIPLKENETLVN